MTKQCWMDGSESSVIRGGLLTDAGRDEGEKRGPNDDDVDDNDLHIPEYVMKSAL